MLRDVWCDTMFKLHTWRQTEKGATVLPPTEKWILWTKTFLVTIQQTTQKKFSVKSIFFQLLFSQKWSQIQINTLIYFYFLQVWVWLQSYWILRDPVWVEHQRLWTQPVCSWGGLLGWNKGKSKLSSLVFILHRQKWCRDFQSCFFDV